MGATNVVSEYRALHSANNPSRPLNTYGKLRAIRVNILSITLIGGNGKAYTGATVRFQRTVYDKNSTVSTLLDNKIATMGFVYQDNLEMSDSLRVENPLGFRVTDYRVDNDYSALPVAPAAGAVINAQTQAAVQQQAMQQPMTGMTDPNAAGATIAPRGAFRCNKACSSKVARLSNRRSQHFLIKCSRPVSCKRSLQCNPQGMPKNVNGASGR